jgi:hypothetical protein
MANIDGGLSNRKRQMTARRARLAAVVVVAGLVSARAVDGADGRVTDNAGVLVRPPAPASLPDLGAIRAWGEKTSFGGNEIDELKFDGQQAVIVRRSFTSGVETCGLTVFVPTRRGWLPALTVDVFDLWLKVSQDGDIIHIVNSSSKAEVARFSIAQLQADKSARTDGPSHHH